MKIVARWMLACYFLGLAYFAFRPFEPIPGLRYPDAAPATNGVFRAGAALEDSEGAVVLLERLGESGRMSLEILLKTDSLQQGGSARIVSFSRGPMCRNFTLGQSGNGLSFRLRTTATDSNGMHPSLLVPQVFDDQRFQHLAVVYDGSQVRLYVDGQIHSAIGLTGNFDNWEPEHLLVMGDETFGGRPWEGVVKRFSIHDRALGTEEVVLLRDGQEIPGTVYSYPGEGMRPWRYRNPFYFTEPVFNARDCTANIAGFIPLAPLLWLAFPGCFRKKALVFIVPVGAGFLLSGMIELAQRGISGRVPSLVDLAYNVLGAMVGCGLLWLGLKKQEKIK